MSHVDLDGKRALWHDPFVVAAISLLALTVIMGVLYVVQRKPVEWGLVLLFGAIQIYLDVCVLTARPIKR